jgi:peptidoglycan/LPS O-acetylase OafA/YrhL
MTRFKGIDGLRALAVVGVLWAHCWMFLGNPSLNIGVVPLNRIISFGGRWLLRMFAHLW